MFTEGGGGTCRYQYYMVPDWMQDVRINLVKYEWCNLSFKISVRGVAFKILGQNFHSHSFNHGAEIMLEMYYFLGENFAIMHSPL